MPAGTIKRMLSRMRSRSKSSEDKPYIGKGSFIEEDESDVNSEVASSINGSGSNMSITEVQLVENDPETTATPMRHDSMTYMKRRRDFSKPATSYLNPAPFRSNDSGDSINSAGVAAAAAAAAAANDDDDNRPVEIEQLFNGQGDTLKFDEPCEFVIMDSDYDNETSDSEEVMTPEISVRSRHYTSSSSDLASMKGDLKKNRHQSLSTPNISKAINSAAAITGVGQVPKRSCIYGRNIDNKREKTMIGVHVSFEPTILEGVTYSKDAYVRSTKEAPLTVKQAKQILHELSFYKNFEMRVHHDSIQNNHYYRNIE